MDAQISRDCSLGIPRVQSETIFNLDSLLGDNININKH